MATMANHRNAPRTGWARFALIAALWSGAATAQPPMEPRPTLDDNQLARLIWEREGLSAAATVVHLTVRRADNSIERGTGFRVGPRLVVTAKHVVTREGVGGATKAEVVTIELRQGGPDASGPQPVVPSSVAPVPGADVALIDLGAAPDHAPPFLPLGVSSGLERGDFITFFGYGLNEPGAWRVGRVDVPENRDGEVRVAADSARGFSGAPVLNRRGNVIGVLSMGLAGSLYFVPLHRAANQLIPSGVRLVFSPGEERDRVAALPASQAATRERSNPPTTPPSTATATGNCSPVAQNVNGNVVITIECRP
jgi:V8-like Glu-specific endopeptidase